MKPITMDAMLIEGRAMAFVDISPCETTWGCGGAVDECGEKVNNNLRLNKNVALQGSTQEPRSCFAGVSKMTCGLCRRTKLNNGASLAAHSMKPVQEIST
jgi:hypothetical protein